jgi:hypothetical protein
MDKNNYRVLGQGQVFKGNFNVLLQDEENKLKNGIANTDAGAPAWGNFDFTCNIKDIPRSASPHVVLFEQSAKDGSPPFELPIPLE